MKLEKLHVGRSGDQYCLSWYFKRDRYHVWLSCQNLEVEAGFGASSTGPRGLYKTVQVPKKWDKTKTENEVRRLSTGIKKNKDMIAQAVEQAKVEFLFDKCEDELAAAEQKRLVRAAEEHKVTLAKEAGPELLAAARGILYGIEELLRGFRITHVVRGQCKGQKALSADDMSAASEADDQFQKARQVLEAAIRKAEGR